MSEAGSAVAVALFSWWFSTGAILFLNQLPPRTFKVSLAAATVVAGVAVWAIALTLDSATPAGAYVGFLSALALWGWHELSFLTGAITGPVKHSCSPSLKGWKRFKAATGTLITHEIAIFLTLLALIAATLEASNPTAAITFGCLWALRLSAKLNIFLGIPNLSEEFLPAHLDYLKTYFRTAPMNALFPISVTVGTLVAAGLLWPAFAEGASDYQVTAALLVGTLVALGVFEHWMMVLPVPDAALWDWAMRLASIFNSTHGRSKRSERSGVAQLQKYELKTTCDGREQAPLAPALLGGDP